MRFLVVEDEKAAMNILLRAINEVNQDDDVLHSFDRASEAIKDIENGYIPDVCFFDIELPGMKGIELSLKIKKYCPDTNIVFVTGFSEYAVEAIRLRTSGYIMKPATAEKVRYELEHLRTPIKKDETKKIRVQTFGTFEVFSGDKVVEFRRSKSKELFAYLIDRKGGSVTNAEIASVLWEDGVYNRSRQKQLNVIIHEMLKCLKQVNATDVVIKTGLGIMVDIRRVDCDAYRFLDNDTSAINAYHGEYMSSYSWAEFSIGQFEKNMQEKTFEN